MVTTLMPLWKCNTCDGTYTDPLEDGVRYFHVCAPIVVTPGVVDPVTFSFKPPVFAFRPGARDENVDIVRIGGEDDSPPVQVVTTLADGAGRTQVG